MPKSDPGILSQKEYAQVVAYLLKMNRMPAGEAELPEDSMQMKNIRFDTVTAADRYSTRGPRSYRHASTQHPVLLLKR
jgi:hypothetical protein